MLEDQDLEALWLLTGAFFIYWPGAGIPLNKCIGTIPMDFSNGSG